MISPSTSQIQKYVNQHRYTEADPKTGATNMKSSSSNWFVKTLQPSMYLYTTQLYSGNQTEFTKSVNRSPTTTEVNLKSNRIGAQ